MQDGEVGGADEPGLFIRREAGGIWSCGWSSGAGGGRAKNNDDDDKEGDSRERASSR